MEKQITFNVEFAMRYGVISAIIYNYVCDDAIINYDYKTIRQALPFLSSDEIGSEIGRLAIDLENNSLKISGGSQN